MEEMAKRTVEIAMKKPPKPGIASLKTAMQRPIPCYL
jgi:hypothetical protein